MVYHMIWVHFMEVVLYVWKAKRVHPQGIYHVILCALYPEKACVYSKAYKWVLLFCENITDLLRRMQFSSGWDPYAKAGRKEIHRHLKPLQEHLRTLLVG